MPTFGLGPILLASCDPPTVGATQRALLACSPGTRLTTVRSLLDCLAAIRLLDPSLLILDDGIERFAEASLQAVRTVRPELPILYVASRHSFDLERRVRRSGVLLYVARSADPQEFESLVSTILQGRSNRSNP